MSKVVTSVTVATMIALSLAACSTPADDGCEATPSGSLSSSITVSGEFGKEPNVTLPSPFEAAETERTVLISGTGKAAANGETVTAHYGTYNAATGDPVQLSPESTWSELPFAIGESAESVFPGLYKSLLCAHEGDRIVSVIPAAELFGESGPNFGVGATDTLVFIFDVTKVEPTPEATPTAEPTPEPLSLPTPAPWVENVPTVDLSGDIPVVAIPQTEPPAELQLKVLNEGDGDLVGAFSNVNVTLDYQGISWNTGEVFDQSFTRDEPSTFPVGGVIKGFAAAMVNQKVGSTLLVTIPPASAYGEGEINEQNLQGQTLVFLIHILGVQ